MMFQTIIILMCWFQTIQAAELIDSEFRSGMSSRQKNKAKRMAKLVAKQKSRDVDPNEKRSNLLHSSFRATFIHIKVKIYFNFTAVVLI